MAGGRYDFLGNAVCILLLGGRILYAYIYQRHRKIPSDLYEAVLIDGAGKFKQFWYITLPLLKGVFKTNITFWTINTTAFFVWTKMFSPIQSENGTIVPLVYMYEMIFGSKTIRTTDAGAGAAIGCVLTVCVMIVFLLINRFIKDDDLEY